MSRRDETSGRSPQYGRETARITAWLTRALLTTVFVAVPLASAAHAQDGEFAEADVYAELNNSDGDLGFHALVDGDAWRRLNIKDPSGRKILWVKPQGRLGRQGLTELFFESAEPPFDVRTPEQFFRRFPDGEYQINGRTLDGQKLQSVDEFSHVMPAPPVIYVNDSTDPLPSVCDDAEVQAFAGLTSISWDPVTDSHPTIGEPGDIEVELYELVVERLNEDQPALAFTYELDADVTEVVLPAGLANSGDKFKVEVLVKEEGGGNQTATESCFDIQ